VELSEKAGHTPRFKWRRIEAELKDAFSDFLMRQEPQASK